MPEIESLVGRVSQCVAVVNTKLSYWWGRGRLTQGFMYLLKCRVHEYWNVLQNSCFFPCGQDFLRFYAHSLASKIVSSLIPRSPCLD